MAEAIILRATVQNVTVMGTPMAPIRAVVSAIPVTATQAVAVNVTTGIQGRPGVSGASFTYRQVEPSAVWTITHNLGRHPSVTVVDTALTVVHGGARYLDANTIQLTFGAAFSGSAFLN